MLMEEVWRDVLGYEGLYQVSNLGRVISLKRIVKCNKGYKLKPETILKYRLDKYGYPVVNISINCEKNTKKIHRLVAEAFLPNPNNLPQVNHKDETKDNNFVYVNPDGSIDESKSNLEWCNYKYNINYGTRSTRSGIKRRKALDVFDYNGVYIRRFSSPIEAAETLNISLQAIYICLRRNHKTSGYLFYYV